MTRAQRAFTCDHLGPAYEGLCKGAIAYDPSRSFRPSSYLVARVKGELMHHLRDTGFSLRISHRLRELWFRSLRKNRLNGRALSS